MKTKLFYLCIIVVFFLSMSGCFFRTHGESLASFSNRMNVYNPDYNMVCDGYIIDTSDSSFTKFFKLGEKELLLKFRHDEKNRLTEMHLVFPQELSEESSDSYHFILNSIKSFCQNEAVAEEIINSVNFNNTINTISKETTSAEVGNIKMDIDTTQLGTVVSLYKDI